MGVKVKVEARRLNGIWVPVEINMGEKTITTTALINTGFFYMEEKSKVPIITLPQGLLLLEGISWLYPSKNNPDLLELEIKTARVRVVTQDRATDWVEGEVYGSFKDHTILSKDLAGKLGVRIEDLYENTWSLKGENKIRKSAEATIYELLMK